MCSGRRHHQNRLSYQLDLFWCIVENCRLHDFFSMRFTWRCFLSNRRVRYNRGRFWAGRLCRCGVRIPFHALKLIVPIMVFPLRMLHCRYNQDSACTQPLVETGNLNNYCYEGQPSVKFDYPYKFVYNTTDCTGVALAVEADANMCEFTTGADDDDDDFAKDNSYQSIYSYSGDESDDDDDDDDDSQSCLSTGAIVGIALGCTAAGVLAAVCAMWAVKIGMFAGKPPLSAQHPAL